LLEVQFVAIVAFIQVCIRDVAVLNAALLEHLAILSPTWE